MASSRAPEFIHEHRNKPEGDCEPLKRSAFLYIRQSTARQVLEHTESTARQYALRKRAVALGGRMTKSL